MPLDTVPCIKGRNVSPPRGPAVYAKIVDAAYRLFVERGFNEVSVEQISEACSVSRRTIYNKFLSKAHIYRAVFEPVIDRLEAAAPTRPFGCNDLGKLLHRYAAEMSNLVRMPELIDLLRVLVFDAEGQSWLACAFIERVRRPIRAAFIEDVERLVTQGELPDHDARVLSDQFFATTLGLLAFPQLLQFEPDRSSKEADATLKAAVDSLLIAWKAAA